MSKMRKTVLHLASLSLFLSLSLSLSNVLLNPAEQDFPFNVSRGFFEEETLAVQWHNA